MQLQDINVGDVLLFSAEKNSAISQIISWLTNSSVSHAGMYYSKDKFSFINQNPPQVAIGQVDKTKNRTIYVYRHNSSLPTEPVINAATRYLNNKDPYDMAELYFIGLLLLYKKVSIPNRTQKIIIMILKKLTASIVEHINKHKNPGKNPMVCSQFVAQCFEDAGSAYRLRFKDSILNSCASRPDSNVEKSLLEQTIATWDSYPEHAMATSSLQSEIPYSNEQLCQMLQEALYSGEVEAEHAPHNAELVDAISHFVLAHHHQPENTRFLVTPRLKLHAIQQFNTDLTMYVFPGDLMNHCLSLKSVGTIEL